TDGCTLSHCPAPEVMLCGSAMSGAKCPLRIISRHSRRFARCPLYPRKRTSALVPDHVPHCRVRQPRQSQCSAGGCCPAYLSVAAGFWSPQKIRDCPNHAAPFDGTAVLDESCQVVHAAASVLLQSI